MIEFEDVRKRLGGQTILDGVSLQIAEGETFALLGPSGTGKSVLLKHVVGLFDPDGGDVRVDGMSVPRAGRREIEEIRSRVSYVFQDSALFDSITVAENVRMGLGTEARGDWTDEERSRVGRALDLVNLSPADGRKLPGELSGGMRKRVALARALVGGHNYMLYDEPTTGLDPINTSVTSELIRRCHEEDECETDVLVTHDMELAFSLADRAAVLAEGRVRDMGTPERLLDSDDPFVQRFLNGNLTGGENQPRGSESGRWGGRVSPERDRPSQARTRTGPSSRSGVPSD